MILILIFSVALIACGGMCVYHSMLTLFKHPEERAPSFMLFAMGFAMIVMGGMSIIIETQP